MRVLVCGGRNFYEYKFVEEVLDKYDITTLCEGGARGADSLARTYARINKIPCETFKADWFTHGKAAGPIRNQKMLTEFEPDIVIAFPGGSGTAHMVKIAKRAGVDVKEFIE